jgi:hypothetical protein
MKFCFFIYFNLLLRVWSWASYLSINLSLTLCFGIISEILSYLNYLILRLLLRIALFIVLNIEILRILILVVLILDLVHYRWNMRYFLLNTNLFVFFIGSMRFRVWIRILIKSKLSYHFWLLKNLFNYLVLLLVFINSFAVLPHKFRNINNLILKRHLWTTFFFLSRIRL